MTIKLDEVITCPHCRKPINAVSGVGMDPMKRPKPGDLSLCFYCAEFSLFTQDGSLRILTDEEREQVNKMDKARIAQRSVLERKRDEEKLH